MTPASPEFSEYFAELTLDVLILRITDQICIDNKKMRPIHEENFPPTSPGWKKYSFILNSVLFHGICQTFCASINLFALALAEVGRRQR
jgi:hypothetical protein